MVRLDSPVNLVKLVLAVLPAEMVPRVRRVCWVWQVREVLPETMASMDRVDFQVLPVLLVLQVMESVMTQLLWRRYLATDKLVT